MTNVVVVFGCSDIAVYQTTLHPRNRKSSYVPRIAQTNLEKHNPSVWRLVRSPIKNGASKRSINHNSNFQESVLFDDHSYISGFEADGACN